jgi:hypothetical protein
MYCGPVESLYLLHGNLYVCCISEIWREAVGYEVCILGTKQIYLRAFRHSIESFVKYTSVAVQGFRRVCKIEKTNY